MKKFKFKEAKWLSQGHGPYKRLCGIEPKSRSFISIFIEWLSSTAATAGDGASPKWLRLPGKELKVGRVQAEAGDHLLGTVEIGALDCIITVDLWLSPLKSYAKPRMQPVCLQGQFQLLGFFDFSIGMWFN